MNWFDIMLKNLMVLFFVGDKYEEYVKVMF